MDNGFIDNSHELYGGLEQQPSIVDMLGFYLECLRPNYYSLTPKMICKAVA